MSDEILTVTKAAERLGCHPATVRRLIAAGRLPAQDISTGDRPTYRVPESSLRGLSVRAPGRPAKEPADA